MHNHIKEAILIATDCSLNPGTESFDGRLGNFKILIGITAHFEVKIVVVLKIYRRLQFVPGVKLIPIRLCEFSEVLSYNCMGGAVELVFD